RFVIAGPPLLVNAIRPTAQYRPGLFGQVREGWGRQQQIGRDGFVPDLAPNAALRLRAFELVAQDHQLRDHGVEAKAFDVLPDALDRGVHGAAHIDIGPAASLLRAWRRRQIPDVAQQVADGAQCALVDRSTLVPRSQEGQPAAYRVGAGALDVVVRIDDVA